MLLLPKESIDQTLGCRLEGKNEFLGCKEKRPGKKN
jgi:hypothetical protein